MLSTLNFPQWLMYNRIVHSCQTPWYIIASEALSCSTVLCYHYECVHKADTRHGFLLRTGAVKPLWLPALLLKWGYKRSLWNHSTTPNCSKQPCLINAAHWISQKHIHQLFIQYSFYFNICYTTRTDMKPSFLSLSTYLSWIRHVPGVQASRSVFFFYKMPFLLFTHSKWISMENRICFLSCQTCILSAWHISDCISA